MPPKSTPPAPNQQLSPSCNLPNYTSSNDQSGNSKHEAVGGQANEAADQLRARQMNPNNELYQTHRAAGFQGNQATVDLRSRQMNPKSSIHQPRKQ